MDVVPWRYKWVGGLNGKKIPPLVFDNHVVEFPKGLLNKYVNVYCDKNVKKKYA